MVAMPVPEPGRLHWSNIEERDAIKAGEHERLSDTITIARHRGSGGRPEVGAAALRRGATVRGMETDRHLRLVEDEPPPADPWDGVTDLRVLGAGWHKLLELTEAHRVRLRAVALRAIDDGM